MNKKITLCLSSLAVLAIVSTIAAVEAQTDVAGGYDTGFARGTEEAHTAINQFDKGSLKSIDADRPPSCPVADKQDHYCDGWKDGWRQTVLDELD
ncbi:MAG: hypothetical protein ACJ73C_10500 [Nitrososphaeraceae archaeon]